jgi:hypothetical protein
MGDKIDTPPGADNLPLDNWIGTDLSINGPDVICGINVTLLQKALIAYGLTDEEKSISHCRAQLRLEIESAISSMRRHEHIYKIMIGDNFYSA